MKNTNVIKMYLLQFFVQEIRICMDLQYVKKVFLLPLLQQIPQSPDYVAGLINIEGQSVPVVDLILQLGLSRTEPYLADTPIILCSDECHQVGMIVDKIQDLGALSEGLQMTEEFAKPTSPFHGVVSVNGDLSLLLNIERVLDVVLSSNDSPFQIDKNVSNFIGNRNA